MSCKCAFLSTYTGLKQDCAECRKPADKRMQEFYELLCSTANALDEAGSPTKADKIREWAAQIPFWFKR